MCHPIRRGLLVLVLGIILSPAMGIAGSVGSETPPSVSNSDASSIRITEPAPQSRDLKYTDMAPSVGQSAVAGENGIQGNAPSQSVPKAKINVVYDQDTERDRGTLITLVIAFGISLALNIYLATSLIAARKGM